MKSMQCSNTLYAGKGGVVLFLHSNTTVGASVVVLLLFSNTIVGAYVVVLLLLSEQVFTGAML